MKYKTVPFKLISIGLIFMFFFTSKTTKAQVFFSCPSDTTICIDANQSCTATFTLTQPDVATNCPSGTLNYSYTGDLGNGDLPDTGILFTDLNFGNYAISITAQDECGDMSFCEIKVTVEECELSGTFCNNGLQVSLLPLDPDTDLNGDGSIDPLGTTLWASDFFNGNVTTCSGVVQASIHFATFIDSGEEVPDPDHNQIHLVCEDVGEHIVNVYLWDGNQIIAQCQTDLFVTNKLGIDCNLEPVTLSGQIKNKEGEPIKGVNVFLSGAVSNTTRTDENGIYSFEVFQGSWGYTITPFFNDDWWNGVDSADSKLLGDHLLNINQLSPYQIIAGDISNSQGVSTFDVVIINRLAGGVIDEIENNTSWKFVQADHVFTNPFFPWEDPIPDAYNLSTVNASTNGLDFIGIKIGDVDCSAFTDLTNLQRGTITGKVFFDSSLDCEYEVGETPLTEWIIVAEGEATRYATTDDNGGFFLNLPTGAYMVYAIPKSPYWEACTATIPIQIDSNEIEQIAIPMQRDIECPYLSVDLSVPFLRRCFSNRYTVSYCNDGTLLAEDAYIELTIDDYFEVESSEIPWLSVEGNTYTFPLGNLDIGECGRFYLDVLVSCEAEIGQTHCMKAEIFPNESCMPSNASWDGSNLVVRGTCKGDSLNFEIRNIGQDMDSPVQYMVIEDDLIMMTSDPFQLASEADLSFDLMANGATFRLEVPQTPGHPSLDKPSVALEGCGTNEEGTFSLGFINQFPQSDRDPAIEIDCQENIGSFDPNDKAAFPVGYQAAHFMEPNTDIEYKIRFQNTGTDTAFNVVIRDTLSPFLDPTTIGRATSSHNYEMALDEQGVLIFRFNNIMLPDSNINEPASHGFVKFRISQLRDNPIGTRIENDAAIYFDFNEPIITNTTFHTIGRDFIDVVSSTFESLVEGVEIEAYPNPFKHEATINLKGYHLEDGQFILRNLQGQAMKTIDFYGQKCVLKRGDLSKGVYFFQVLDGNRWIGTGKLIIQ